MLTQKMTSITASFRENMAAIDECKELISKLKVRKFSYLMFSLLHPYGVKIF